MISTVFSGENIPMSLLPGGRQGSNRGEGPVNRGLLRREREKSGQKKAATRVAGCH